jgi:predicted metal-binding membrane protein
MSTINEPAVETRRVPAAIVAAIGLAWVAAIAAHANGNAQLIDHDALLGAGTPSLEAIATYATAWIVMVAAMMLPSAVPLVRLYAATSANQPRARVPLAVFIGGYLAVWIAFGWLALAFDSGVHHGVDAWPWLEGHPAFVIAAVLALAGAFQFSSLKDRCLDTCRHPAAYLLAHYRRGTSAALRLGWNHGVFCLGCCWALMLVAFATGMADLRLMAAFTALMGYEKTGRRGETVARLAGAALLVLAAAAALLSV